MRIRRLVFMVLLLIAARPAGAQEDGGLVHVVQPGENLFRIALNYGVDMDTLARLNGITDPTTIYAGQELVIPGAGPRHTVQPGDTLPLLAQHYGVTLEALRAANSQVDADRLSLGQSLALPEGSNPSSEPPRALPAPITALGIDPLPPRPGHTFGIRLTTSEPATVTGSFMDRLLGFGTADGLTHAAVFGIEVTAPPGLYPMTVFVRAGDDTLTIYEADILVSEQNFGWEYIGIPSGLYTILDPAVTEPELALLAGYMTTFTPAHHWEGPFRLPASGGITSQFGTNRSYADRMYTFHSGVDFGGAPGTPVFAPAAGRVVHVDVLDVRGNVVILDHGWGVYTGYWHLSAAYVTPGQMVQAGEHIGAIGSTGLSTGPHLHWEMRVSGVAVNPMQWVERAFP